MKITIAALSLISGLSSVFAQGQPDGRPILGLMALAQTILSQAVPILIGCALVGFFYGLVIFIWKGKEGGEALAKSKQFMIYSIGALFVMVSIWGIIALMQDTLNVRNRDIVFPDVTGQRK
jgi:hypothetical protein